MPRTADSGFDAAVVDRENHAVALIQVKAYPVGAKWETIVRGQLERFADHIDFVMTIDPTRIHTCTGWMAAISAGRLSTSTLLGFSSITTQTCRTGKCSNHTC